MKLTDLIPNINEIVPSDYAEICSPTSEALIESFLHAAPAEEYPLIIHMSGIPGAGKSTFYQTRTWPRHVFIGFDTIMEQIPEYQTDVRTSGPAAAFHKWEIPARIIGYELLRRAVSQRKNIFFDHGALNTGHIELLQNLKNLGYETEMYFINCAPEVAYQRTLRREQLTLRHTPRTLIEQRQALAQTCLSEYRKIIDTIYIFDTTSGKYVLTNTISNRSQRKSA